LLPLGEEFLDDEIIGEEFLEDEIIGEEFLEDEIIGEEFLEDEIIGEEFLEEAIDSDINEMLRSLDKYSLGLLALALFGGED